MSESTERWRDAARAAAKDVRKVAAKHLPALREQTRAVIESELPKVKKELPRVAKAVREEIPKVAEAIRREFEGRRRG